MSTADAIVRTLESPNVIDSNFEPANVVDVLNHLSNATGRVAKAVTPSEGVDVDKGADSQVTSLTEAVVGMTKGLFAIAKSIDSLAEAVKERDLSA